LILPQLDMLPMYQRIKMGAPLNYRTTANNQVVFDNSLVARTSMPILKCPTDIGDGTALTSTSDQTFGQLLQPNGEDNSSSSSTVAVTNYKACNGSFYPSWNSTTSSLTAIRRGRNYSKPSRAPSNTDRRDYCSGVICRGYNPTVTDTNKTGEMLFPTSSADIFDGAGMTIAIGESLPSISPWSAWFWWNGSTASTGILPSAGTAYSSPLNYALNRTRVSATFLPTTSATYFYGFNSRHAGSAQFVMCDGAVHPINEGIDRNVFYQLGTIDDREIIDNAALNW
jgi:prepilin-type processing-associated H-X9-DG protein